MLYYTSIIESPYLGICLDTGHAVIRGQNPTEMLRAYKSKLAAVHLHSTVPGIDLHSIPSTYVYGDRVDWKEFYAALCESGYKRTFNLEVRASKKLGDAARSAFYRFAYAVAAEIAE